LKHNLITTNCTETHTGAGACIFKHKMLEKDDLYTVCWKSYIFICTTRVQSVANFEIMDALFFLYGRKLDLFCFRETMTHVVTWRTFLEL